jgi:hypothetical protein
MYDKRDDFTFQIVNSPFIISNIRTEPAYEVYVSQLIHYSRVCQLLTEKLHMQVWVGQCNRYKQYAVVFTNWLSFSQFAFLGLQ